MNNEFPEQILAALDRLGADLGALRKDLDRPRPDLQQRIDWLADTLATIRDDVAHAFAAYQRIETAIQAASDRSDVLEEQVVQMERQVRILSARVGWMEAGDDRAGTA